MEVSSRLEVKECNEMNKATLVSMAKTIWWAANNNGRHGDVQAPIETCDTEC